MIRKVAGWLVRPQFSALAVVAAALIASLSAYHIALWVGLLVAAGIGAGYATATAVVNRFLRRKAAS